MENQYLINKQTRIRFDVFKIFNAKSDDKTDYYASRLQGESADGVNDVHFHPTHGAWHKSHAGSQERRHIHHPEHATLDPTTASRTLTLKSTTRLTGTRIFMALLMEVCLTRSIA